MEFRHLSKNTLSSSSPSKSTTMENSKKPILDKNSDLLISKTPEKPLQLPRRTRNRGVALSLKEVKVIAQGPQKNEKGCSHQSDLDQSHSSVSSLEDVNNALSGVRSVKKLAKAKADVKLPEKYEMLADFFRSLESSIRLLRRKRSRTTFTNICPPIETLTQRSFSYGHLAQLKYILPEAISIEKILVRDEETLCIKPDLQVTLNLDVFESSGDKKRESGYSVLRKVFHARLLDFFKKHPEGEDIPEATLPGKFNKAMIELTLPDLFDKKMPTTLTGTRIVTEETLQESCNQTEPDLLSSISKTSGSHLPLQPSSETILQRSSHMSQSFRRRFSQKILPELERSPLEPSTSHRRSVVSVTNTQQPSLVSVYSPIKYSSQKPPMSERLLACSPSSFKLPKSNPLTVYEDKIKPMEGGDQAPKETGNEVSPMKLISTPSRLMITTPGLQTPKRYHPSPDNDFTSPNKMVINPNRIRSLQFDTPVKKAKLEEKNERGISGADADQIKFLPRELMQSVREKERKAMEDSDAGLSDAKLRIKMILHLPKLFQMIQLIFQSMNRSVLTKQELIHKIIANHCDIIDRREAEEQLKLLQELVPDFLSGKVSSSGDFLFCINKATKLESIHERLAEAKRGSLMAI